VSVLANAVVRERILLLILWIGLAPLLVTPAVTDEVAAASSSAPTVDSFDVTLRVTGAPGAGAPLVVGFDADVADQAEASHFAVPARFTARGVDATPVTLPDAPGLVWFVGIDANGNGALDPEERAVRTTMGEGMLQAHFPPAP